MNLVCKKCLYPITHPLGINFDSNGICSGCLVHQEKKDKQWNMRLNKLKKIVKEYKKPNNEYDCIVPVNGGSDSFFTIFYVKEILKLKPLCVNYNSLYFNKLGHYNLSTLRRKFNVDINIHTPAKNQVLAINKASLYCKYSMYWHVHAGTTAYPLHVSIRKKIPLIIWGSNESVEQVGMFSHDDEVEMSRRYRHNHHLLSNELTDLEKVEPSIKRFNNFVYNYPEYNQIKKINIRGIYLSNYLPWNQKLQHEFVCKNYNYKIYNFKNTFNGYEHPHCSFYNGIHDWLKYLKHGYGRMLDHIVREIRWNRITTDEAIYYIKKFKPVKPVDNIKMFSEFMGIKDNAMNFILKSAKNKELFDENQEFELSQIYKKIGNLSKNENYEYALNKIDQSFVKEGSYIYDMDNNDYMTFDPGYN